MKCSSYESSAILIVSAPHGAWTITVSSDSQEGHFSLPLFSYKECISKVQKPSLQLKSQWSNKKYVTWFQWYREKVGLLNLLPSAFFFLFNMKSRLVENGYISA